MVVKKLAEPKLLATLLQEPGRPAQDVPESASLPKMLGATTPGYSRRAHPHAAWETPRRQTATVASATAPNSVFRFGTLPLQATLLQKEDTHLEGGGSGGGDGEHDIALSGLELATGKLTRLLSARAAEYAQGGEYAEDRPVAIEASCNRTTAVPLPTGPALRGIFGRNLTRLNLSHNRIANLRESECASLPSLTALDLSANLLTSSRGLEANVRLVTLNMAGNKLKVVGGLEALSRLRDLDVAHCNLSTALACRSLPLNTRLKTLDVSGNPVAESQHHMLTIRHFLLGVSVAAQANTAPRSPGAGPSRASTYSWLHTSRKAAQSRLGGGGGAVELAADEAGPMSPLLAATTPGAGGWRGARAGQPPLSATAGAAPSAGDVEAVAMDVEADEGMGDATAHDTMLKRRERRTDRMASRLPWRRPPFPMPPGYPDDAKWAGGGTTGGTTGKHLSSAATRAAQQHQRPKPGLAPPPPPPAHSPIGRRAAPPASARRGGQHRASAAAAATARRGGPASAATGAKRKTRIPASQIPIRNARAVLHSAVAGQTDAASVAASQASTNDWSVPRRQLWDDVPPSAVMPPPPPLPAVQYPDMAGAYATIARATVGSPAARAADAPTRVIDDAVYAALEDMISFKRRALLSGAVRRRGQGRK